MKNFINPTEVATNILEMRMPGGEQEAEKMAIHITEITGEGRIAGGQWEIQIGNTTNRNSEYVCLYLFGQFLLKIIIKYRFYLKFGFREKCKIDCSHKLFLLAEFCSVFFLSI